MAIINQEGVNNVVSSMNTCNNEFTSTVSTGVSNFTDELSNIWASNNATKFASNFQTDLTNLVDSYVKNTQGMYDTLSTNVSNHNSRNDGSVSVNTLELTSPDVSCLTTKIKNQAADGSEGIAAGTDIAGTVAQFSSLVQKIIEEANTLVANLRNSSAFDEEEINAMAAKQETINKAFEEAAKNEESSLKTYMENEKELDAKLLQTNKDNWA